MGSEFDFKVIMLWIIFYNFALTSFVLINLFVTETMKAVQYLSKTKEIRINLSF